MSCKKPVICLLCQTRLLKPTSWRCCGKTHDETYNEFSNFAVLQ